MTQESRSDRCCDPVAPLSCCQVEALVSIDERGQMVLPKELREKANIRAGDKLAVATWQKDGKVCCISLIKAEELTGMVRDMLAPLMSAILLEGGEKR